MDIAIEGKADLELLRTFKLVSNSLDEDDRSPWALGGREV